MKKFTDYTNIPVSSVVRNALQQATILQTKFEDQAIRSAYFLIGAIAQKETVIEKFFIENGLALDASDIINTIVTNPSVFASVFDDEFCDYFFGDEEEENSDENEEEANESDEENDSGASDENGDGKFIDAKAIIKENVEKYVEDVINEQTEMLKEQEYLTDITIKFSVSLYEALEKASVQCKKTNSKVLVIDPIIYYLLKIPESSAYKLMKMIIDDVMNNVTIDDFIRYIENNSNIFKTKGGSKNSLLIPSALENCCEVLNNKYKKGQKCEILCRDKEIAQLWSIISKKTKRNSILVGKPGVGKTAIVEALTQQIVNKECPKEFENYLVVNFDIDSLVAGTKYRGEFEEKIVLFKEFINMTHNVILFIDEIHRTRGAGTSEGGTSDLSGALKPILSRDDTIVIGTTTFEEYKYFIESDKAYKRRFEVIEVKEPKYDKVEQMISKKVEALKKFHNVSLANGVLKFIITASSCFNIDSSNPDKTLDLCDRAMVVAKLAGSDKVTKQHVKQVFLNSIELFNGMAKEDVLQIAYHEAAHYVVAKMTSSIKKDDVIAISILPTSTYLGVNVTEKNDFFVNFDSKYCLDEIATLLAGKAIEEMRFGIVTTGPTNDLEQATSIAKNYISVFGMDKDIGIASYGAESNILDSSNECINMINSKINQILAEQYKRAKEILADNSEFLNVVANALVKNCILVKSDLDKIYQNCNCANVASC